LSFTSTSGFQRRSDQAQTPVSMNQLPGLQTNSPMAPISQQINWNPTAANPYTGDPNRPGDTGTIYRGGPMDPYGNGSTGGTYANIGSWSQANAVNGMGYGTSGAYAGRNMEQWNNPVEILLGQQMRGIAGQDPNLRSGQMVDPNGNLYDPGAPGTVQGGGGGFQTWETPVFDSKALYDMVGGLTHEQLLKTTNKLPQLQRGFQGAAQGLSNAYANDTFRNSNPYSQQQNTDWLQGAYRNLMSKLNDNGVL
jgi:hypothetical protein